MKRGHLMNTFTGIAVARYNIYHIQDVWLGRKMSSMSGIYYNEYVIDTSRIQYSVALTTPL